MWRIILYGFTAIISAQTIRALVTLDLANFSLGLFLSGWLIYWSIRVYKKQSKADAAFTKATPTSAEVQQRYKESKTRARQEQKNDE